MSRLVHEVHNIANRLWGIDVIGDILWEQEHLIPNTVELASSKRALQTDAVS